MPTATKPPEKIDFVMEYETPCPNCTSAGVSDARLGFSPAHGGIVCASGEHRFDALPGTGALPQPEPASASPAASQDAGQVVLTGFPVATKGGSGKVDGAKVETLRHRLAEAMQEQMRENARKPAAVKKVPQELPEPVRPRVLESREGPRKPVQVLDSRPAPGGDLEITLVLREPHVQAIRAEAEVQRQTVEVYLQEWIERALDSYWSR